MEPEKVTTPACPESPAASLAGKCRSPAEYDSGIATDDGGGSGGRDTEVESPISSTAEGARVSEHGGAVTPEHAPGPTDTLVPSNRPPRIITCALTVALAIPGGLEKEETSKSYKSKRKLKHFRGVLEAPKAQSYYHIEYCLLPDDLEPTKVDLVTFGLVAKLYMENETKILKPWSENGHTWLAWCHKVKINVAKEFLIKLVSHKLTFRIWDTKDKVSTKARFDRPKAFRLPQSKPGEDPENVGGVKHLVLKQKKLFENSQPKPSCVKTQQHQSPQAQQQSGECSKTGPQSPVLRVDIRETSPPTTGLQTVLSDPPKVDDIPPLRSSSLLTPLAGAPSPRERQLKAFLFETKSSKAKPSSGRSEQLTPGRTTGHKSSIGAQSAGTGKSGRRKGKSAREKLMLAEEWQQSNKASGEDLAAPELAKKKRPSVIEMNFMPLLAGEKSVTDRLTGTSSGVLDAYLTVAVDEALISEELKYELNPLVIRLISATSLPTTPVPIQVLKEKCVPVYCRYRFFNLPFHQTRGREHGTHIYFNDVNVILTGTINAGELWEYLQGPAMEIEVHDRDSKVEEIPQKPALFGTDPNDEKLSNVGLVSSKPTVLNPFMDRGKTWHPHGTARVDFSELLHGEKYLNLSVPIHSCTYPDLNGSQNDGRDGSLTRVTRIVDGPRSPLLPAACYLESESQLKIRAEIAVPLLSDTDAVKSKIANCPFSRIIYIFGYNNQTFLQDLLSDITEINAAALQFNLYAKHTIERTLSTYKLSHDQKESLELDIITGFHVMDGSIHMFVLEGLKDKAIRKLWEKISVKISGVKEEKLDVLYNSDLFFSQRLYSGLDAIICHVRLHEPLSAIVRQPLLYVRDMVPRACFQALSRLDYISHAKKLKDVVQGNLFPTAEMIMLLSQEFGIPLSKEDLTGPAVPQQPPNLQLMKSEIPVHSKGKFLHPTLDNYSARYIEWKQGVGGFPQEECFKDYIQNNIDAVHQASKKLNRPKVDTIKAIPADGKSVYNYSSQTLNSTVLAMELLRKEMAKEPTRRFTYSQEYQSATVDPISIDSEIKAAASKYKALWNTYDGFRYPGFKSSIESNQHPRKPDEACIEELKQMWKENILHANTLQPTLARDRWGWSERDIDFELYKKPAHSLSLSAPVTIHLAGKTLENEQLDAARDYYLKWRSKVIVDDTRMKFHRHAIESELQTEGPNASTQTDKLVGLLKDAPVKHSLRKPGMVLKPFPALAVMQNPVSEERFLDPVKNERETNSGFSPGLYDQHSLKWNTNMIPRLNMEHRKFERLKGKDFNFYYYGHPFLHRREIKALSEEEKDNVLFQIPGPTDEASPVAKKVQRSGNLVETNTYNSVLLHIT